MTLASLRDGIGAGRMSELDGVDACGDEGELGAEAMVLV